MLEPSTALRNPCPKEDCGRYLWVIVFLSAGTREHGCDDGSPSTALHLGGVGGCGGGYGLSNDSLAISPLAHRVAGFFWLWWSIVCLTARNESRPIDVLNRSTGGWEEGWKEGIA